MTLFIIVAGHVAIAASPNNKVVFTDVLDDDIRALAHMLSRQGSNTSVKAIVVSTGNVYLKAAVAKRIVQGFGLDIPIFVGTATDLGSNPVTRFAAKYELEGKPLLTDSEIIRLRKLDGKSGNASTRIQQLFKKSDAINQQLDIVLLTSPIDLVKAVNSNQNLGRRVLADVFAMGFYKENNLGELIAPYNTMAEPSSVIEFLRLYTEDNIFKNVFHVPSDTVQKRAHLDGGYIPHDAFGKQIKLRIKTALQKNPFLSTIFAAAQEYGLSWRNAASQQFGHGFEKNDMWVRDSIQPPEEAAGFYLADTIPVSLSENSEAELAKLKFKRTSVMGPAFGADLNQPFKFVRTESKRELLDLVDFDGPATLQEHTRRLEGASAIQPSNNFSQPLLINITKDDEGIKYYDATDRQLKAMVLVFKNSPDDWFALLRLASTESGRRALENGGVIVEAFQTETVRKNVISFLHTLGVDSIPVAAGYQYTNGETASIGNFVGENALNEFGEATRAFNKLSYPNSGINIEKIYNADEIIERSNAWAKKYGKKVDAVILGEGIDLFRAFKKSPLLVNNFENFYVMGGGRLKPGTTSNEFDLSRNWLPHSDEVLTTLDNIGRYGKNVFIFSSQDFGGLIIAGTDSNLGNGKAALSALDELASHHEGLRALREHWVNWARVYEWVLRPSSEQQTKGPFDPNKKIALATTSPLALAITDEWLLGELELGTSKIEKQNVSLTALATSHKFQVSNDRTGVFWLRPKNMEVVALTQRFGMSIDAIGRSSLAKKVSTAVQHLPFGNETAIERLRELEYKASSCSKVFH